MTTLSDPDPDSRVIDIASAPWCWSRLRGTSKGQMSYWSERRQANLAVLYTLDAHEITIPIGAADGTEYSAVGSEITLEVTGSTEDDVLWTVRATGLASLQSSEQPGRAQSASSARRRPSYGMDPSVDSLIVPIIRIRGFYETSLTTGDMPAIDPT